VIVMFGTFGFSYVGLIFLCCLFIPNICYGFHQPVDRLNVRENKLLLAFERSGQILCTVLVVIFDDFNVHPLNFRAIWLGTASLLMILYLICWGRYFMGGHTSRDFYRPFLGVPLPLAVLPVTAIFLLSVYGKVIALSIAAVLLGIGHIGITQQHRRALQKLPKQ
jgi:hypothetical protein